MQDVQTAYLSGVEMASAFRAGKLSPVEVHDAIQCVIDAREPTINALTVRNAESSRSLARDSERRWASGQPLSTYDGVPITFKENIAQAGVPMSLGNAGVDPQVPSQSAPTVLRAEKAGLVLIGTTTMPDWGMLSSGLSSRWGVTRSPVDPDLTTGGSSSGAGAAAAGGYGPWHVGTDIGGSIRLPGSWLGLSALKPTSGRLALHNPTLGRAAGPLTRDVKDTAAMMSVLAGQDPVDVTSISSSDVRWDNLDLEPRGLRIGLLTDAGCGGGTTPDVVGTVEQAALAFEAAGADVVKVEPFMTQDLLDALDLFWRVRSWVDLRALDQKARNRVLPYVAQWCTGGADVSGARVMECYHSVMEIQRRAIVATESFDLFLSPVSPVAAFAAEQPMPFTGDHATMHHIGYTAPFNMSGQPATSVNCGHTDDGRTIGLQVAAARGADVRVLQAAFWFESARDPSAEARWPSHELVPGSWEGKISKR